MVVLLTYDVPHRKTQDVATRLLAADITFQVVATPFVERQPRFPLFAHRPHEEGWPCLPIDPWSWETLGIAYEEVEVRELGALIKKLSPDLIIIGGAGILPAQVVMQNKTLNVHPGHLPAARGLDVLKWSIHRMERIGVTAHLCDAKTDLGWKLIENPVRVRSTDTLHSIALRQYEVELSMFVPAARKALATDTEELVRVDKLGTEPCKRMPRAIEAELPERFEQYKRVYAS